MRVLNTTLILIGLLFLAGCSSNNKTDKRGEKYGGTLRLNSGSIPSLILPGLINKESEYLIVNQVYCGLVKYHTRTLEVIPSIALHWKIDESGTLYTFILREDAYFHDDPCFEGGLGRRIVASDFKFSLEQIIKNLNRQQNPNSQFRNLEGFNAFYESETFDGDISGIKAVNDTTLTFKLLTQDAMFIHFLAGNYGLVFPREGFKKYGLRSHVGSGAFVFKYPEERGAVFTLISNKNYFEKTKAGESLPYIDSIVVSFITSTPKELEMLKNNQTDVVMGLTDEYVTPFLDKHIDDFQSNPPQFVLQQSVDIKNGRRYNIIRSNVRNFDINSQMYFDLAKVYLADPLPYRIPMNQ